MRRTVHRLQGLGAGIGHLRDAGCALCWLAALALGLAMQGDHTKWAAVIKARGITVQ